MTTNLLESVLVRLDRREPAWTKVAEGSGVPYNTLKKIATRTTPNPGVKHVQALANFFSQTDAAGSHAQPPAAATGVVVAGQGQGV